MYRRRDVPRYRVRWELDVEADTWEQAALLARLQVPGVDSPIVLDTFRLPVGVVHTKEIGSTFHSFSRESESDYLALPPFLST